MVKATRLGYELDMGMKEECCNASLCQICIQWIKVPFIEVGSRGGQSKLDEGEDQEFSFGHAEFELPLRHLSGDME